ncbi:MAG TPA: hypothetical protein PL064_05865 [Thermogutta sp.]|nr:hypothetical protein [Verrucomicrobiota bacterium]HPZ82938.1 hypothetical protein [Thermogutta sp.]
MVSLFTPFLLRAEVTVFTIDQAQSSLTISGTLLGNPLQEQAPGSLTTDYFGTIVADVTDTTIEFVGGSEIRANDSGTWQPAEGGEAGSAPANYGAQASLLFISGVAALRHIVLDVASPPLPITGGTFPSESMTFSFPTNASTGSGLGQRQRATGRPLDEQYRHRCRHHDSEWQSRPDNSYPGDDVRQFFGVQRHRDHVGGTVGGANACGQSAGNSKA